MQHAASCFCLGRQEVVQEKREEVTDGKVGRHTWHRSLSCLTHHAICLSRTERKMKYRHSNGRSQAGMPAHAARQCANVSITFSSLFSQKQNVPVRIPRASIVAMPLREAGKRLKVARCRAC